jgi:hypothetical protein
VIDRECGYRYREVNRPLLFHNLDTSSTHFLHCVKVLLRLQSLPMWPSLCWRKRRTREQVSHMSLMCLVLARRATSSNFIPSIFTTIQYGLRVVKKQTSKHANNKPNQTNKTNKLTNVNAQCFILLSREHSSHGSFVPCGKLANYL